MSLKKKKKVSTGSNSQTLDTFQGFLSPESSGICSFACVCHCFDLKWHLKRKLWAHSGQHTWHKAQRFWLHRFAYACKGLDVSRMSADVYKECQRVPTSPLHQMYRVHRWHPIELCFKVPSLSILCPSASVSWCPKKRDWTHTPLALCSVLTLGVFWAPQSLLYWSKKIPLQGKWHLK